jgi:hypothetical protein
MIGKANRTEIVLSSYINSLAGPGKGCYSGLRQAVTGL